MQINRRGFLTSLLVAPFAAKAIPSLSETLISYDIETVPMPIYIMVDGFSDVWQAKTALFAMNYGMGPKKLAALLDIKEESYESCVNRWRRDLGARHSHVSANVGQ